MLPLTECEAVLQRHQKVALLWSGGKDSTMTLFYLKPFWDRLMVYWLNTGDCPVETLELAERVRRLVPHFREVRSDSLGDMNTHGYPFEAVPESLTWGGPLLSGLNPTFIARPRLDCCMKNIMLPLYERVVADGNTLLIRGQKRADPLRNHLLNSGDVHDGVEAFFPIEDETSESVLAWLRANQPDYLHIAYDLGDTGLIDCVHCTADWGDGSALRGYYPAIAKERAWMRQHVALELLKVVQLDIYV